QHALQPGQKGLLALSGSRNPGAATASIGKLALGGTAVPGTFPQHQKEPLRTLEGDRVFPKGDGQTVRDMEGIAFGFGTEIECGRPYPNGHEPGPLWTWGCRWDLGKCPGGVDQSGPKGPL